MLNQTILLNILLIIVLAPLLAGIVVGIFGTGFSCKCMPAKFAHYITIISVAISCGLSFLVLQQVLLGNHFNASIYEWFGMTGANINSSANGGGHTVFAIGFLVDSLTSLMMCVVTFISLMVQIYSIAYMKGDPGYARFFSYLSLFTFAMLTLVMSDNLLQLFFGWEAVGLLSYLLIGFWYTKESAICASLKAFLVNRVSDFAFILGIALLFSYTGGVSLNYADIFAKQQEINNTIFNLPWLSGLGIEKINLANIICFCLFIGAMGKSAQFPLHVWLPDSMEGPTPISALIHAATMVTAGIFMVSRMSPIFELSEFVLSMMLIIGAITALFMGILGIVQNDIKRVIAYSTLSQLGYMTAAMGASAYSVALFHLTTHAFFKALLFLTAGSVICALHHEQDIRKMGGLWKYMPVTWITAGLGSLALVGTPFFSGFYSKESILEVVQSSALTGATWSYYALLCSVFITAFYSFRMFFLVFHGNSNFDSHENLPCEAPWSMRLPLILLAIPSTIIGAILIEPMLFRDFFAKGVVFTQVLATSRTHSAVAQLDATFNGWLSMAMHAPATLAFWLALSGFTLAGMFYWQIKSISQYFCRFFGWLVPGPTKLIINLLNNKYYLDKLYIQGLTAWAKKFANFLWKKIDLACIDNLVNACALIIQNFAQCIRKIQSGYLFDYVFSMIAGIIGLLSLGIVSSKTMFFFL